MYDGVDVCGCGGSLPVPVVLIYIYIYTVYISIRQHITFLEHQLNFSCEQTRSDPTPFSDDFFD
jgi:hypothetical protein